ncbi:hypothetical protein EXN66_Car006756 [Channa argus]|uniref:Uncharacterized protein n=1 Tax=Channa argus TaxID=215402 RepID=A0A6G1PLE8_CHAAH|nr:hypothetical protein EXN66_Car006756 [Channa argus]
MGRKQRGMQPHTLILSTPSSFLLHTCVKKWGVKERQIEQERRGSIDFCFIVSENLFSCRNLALNY